MKHLLIILSICIAGQAFSQDVYNIVLFSEDGLQFDAYVNAIKQNESPAANIRISDLPSPNAQIKIVFSNGEHPDLSKKVYLQTPNTEVTFNIKNTKKGMKLRYFGEVPLAQAPAMEDEVVYSTSPREEVTQRIEVEAKPVETVTETTTTTVTTETIGVNSDTQISDDGENVSIDINMGGIGFNMDVNVDDAMTGEVTQTTTTTTSTSTTTSSELSIAEDYYEEEVPACAEANVSALKTAMEAESFADDKMDVAKLALRNSCVWTAQVIELAELFDFEDDRLAFAKYAYDRCFDQSEFYQVNSIFDFSSTKEELNEYIMNK